MSDKLNIINNEENMQFEYHEGDEIAKLEYRFYKKDIAFMHTEVPKTLEGRGIASALAEYAFDYAKKINKPVLNYCPFVGVYLKRHPELKEQLDEEYYKG
ncbi:acetyltransferase [Arachidicoccus ginsenosidimutans]|uniref:GNAT family N-acetyltransferase n=1 Tax=Arachidicoccus sp. BS20 TaxID=1850526 RepID=UPI0007F0F0C0|nr:GNAT family N-acetyltransferase [Arachidicoccus sp. BS20]ANI90631.1 acetyltransferase [Arachidicoccus sp. BS20]